MDIVFLTDHLVRGGAETQLTRIAATLKRRGWEVVIVSMFPSVEFLEDLKAADIPLFECSHASPKLTWLMIPMAWRMTLLLRRWRPAVLITFNYHGDIMGRVCGRLAGVPAIVASQRTAYVKTRFREWVYRYTECLIDLTASNSHAAIRYMVIRHILNPMKTMVIHNGIVASSFPAQVSPEQARLEFALPETAFLWLAVGNLRPAKDYPTLLAAAERCVAAVPAFHLLIAGGGEDLDAARAEVERRGLAGKVHYLGLRTDIPALLRACDAFVLSSAWEGMPNTVMEAMASGLPVVSTDAGGVRELVLPGQSGYIVPCGDSAALAGRMIQVMAMDRDTRLRMGASGRERIARTFDNERVVDRWEAMMRRMARAGLRSQRASKPVPVTAVGSGRPARTVLSPPPTFVISMDFELLWGMRDKRTLASYGDHVLGERQAIPAILALFKQYEVKATWAAVGMTLFERRSDLLRNLPDQRPAYARTPLNPYLALDEVGEDEKSDPYHFGLSLVRQVLDCEGMELGSHTFSHYYCLEQGQDAAMFRADLGACVDVSSRLTGCAPTSFVFPRNQYNFEYLKVCGELGFKVFRGNEASWMYAESMEEDQSEVMRGARLLDNYLNISGDHGFIPQPYLDCGLVNCPSSRFLRPFSPRLSLLEGRRVRRIQRAMEAAARKGESFHLWWHPHNFGANLPENLAILEALLRFHVVLRERYGVVAMNMGELGRATLDAEGTR
jgi:glycosyltransferase involved in cell wall biosynthesis/peptidoglycan/xylan/chitin deacetylase (PgdA/CDA1 family)